MGKHKVGRDLPAADIIVLVKCVVKEYDFIGRDVYFMLNLKPRVDAWY